MSEGFTKYDSLFDLQISLGYLLWIKRVEPGTRNTAMYHGLYSLGAKQEIVSRRSVEFDRFLLQIMYIKQVTIDGFKSYAQRTVISGFDPLFNAITGLNGSGKSNILDSICFLLGISNLSQVRNVFKWCFLLIFDFHWSDLCKQRELFRFRLVI